MDIPITRNKIIIRHVYKDIIVREINYNNNSEGNNCGFCVFRPDKRSSTKSLLRGIVKRKTADTVTIYGSADFYNFIIFYKISFWNEKYSYLTGASNIQTVQTLKILPLVILQLKAIIIAKEIIVDFVFSGRTKEVPLKVF